MNSLNNTPRGGRTGFYAIFRVALVPLSFCMLAPLLMAACSAKIDSAIFPSGGARISLAASVPAPLSARLRRLARLTESEPLFSLNAFREAAAQKTQMELVGAAQPDKDSLEATFLIKSLEAFAADPELAGTELLRLNKGPGWRELRLSLGRGQAAALYGLLPGLDPGLVDALSPPALADEEPLNAEEYKIALKSILGEKTMPAFEAADIRIAITAPGKVLASEGGTLVGNTLSLRLPLIDILVLEKNLNLSLRWQSL